MLTQTARVVEYDRDPEQKGRPVPLLLAGAALACLALFLIFVLSFRTWVTFEVEPELAYWGIGLLFCFYILGVYLFSYAFELYDVAKALRLTIIVAIGSVAAILAVLAVLTMLTKTKGAAHAIAAGDEETLDHATSFVPVIGSYLNGNTPAGKETEVRPPDAPFTIACQGCGERFTPAPPDAMCPFCGRAALAAS